MMLFPPVGMRDVRHSPVSGSLHPRRMIAVVRDLAARAVKKQFTSCVDKVGSSK
jgi:hypothetical protein